MWVLEESHALIQHTNTVLFDPVGLPSVQQIILALSEGFEQAVAGGDRPRSTRHLQALHVRLVSGGGDGHAEGALPRSTVAMGTDAALRRSSRLERRSDGRNLQVSITLRCENETGAFYV